MSSVIYRGKIESDFNGFHDNAVFKMGNGTYWVQSKYCYWYYYSYRPDVIILQTSSNDTSSLLRA